MTRVVSLPLFR